MTDSYLSTVSTGYSEYNALSGDIHGNGYDILNVSFFNEVYDYSTIAPTGPNYYTSFSHSTLIGTSGNGLNWIPYSLSNVGEDSSQQPAFTMPDMDRDSVIIEYTGNHYLTYTDPKVLAIIAAAPYFEDVDIRFAPQSLATRAEAATIFTRFIQYVITNGLG